MQRKPLGFAASFSIVPTIPPPVATWRLHAMGVLTVAMVICAGCSSNAEKPAPPPPGVTVISVIQKDVPVHQEWVGTMAGNVDADIRPKVDGFLLSRLYAEGSYVDKGSECSSLTIAEPNCCGQAQGHLEQPRCMGRAQTCAPFHAVGARSC
jgi:hypothetical protein